MSDSQLIDRLGWMLIHSTWQIALIAFLIAIVNQLLFRKSANGRYILGCVGLMMIVVAPVITFISISPDSSDSPSLAAATSVQHTADAGLPDSSLGMLPVPVRQGETATNEDEADVAEIELFTVSPPPTDPVRGRDSDRIADQSLVPAGEGRIVSQLRSAFPWIVACWLVGVVLSCARPLAGFWTVCRVRSVGRSEVSGKLTLIVRRLCRHMGIERTVEVAESALLEVPAVVGVLRPLLLLPATVNTGLTPQQLEAVIAHELAHIRRHDFFVNCLQTLVETLLFYHPAVWWISHFIRQEREHVCDDIAMAVCGNRTEYAQALVAIDSLRRPAPQPVLAANGGSFVRRIRRIMQVEPARSRNVLSLTIPLLLVLGIAVMLILAGGPDVSTRSATAQTNEPNEVPIQPRQDITWTEVPTVDMDDPTLQRGIVYGPDGEPLAGAKVYAASTIELFELQEADEVTAEDLGDVRAVTDELGRFEFHTPDLTWSPAPGQRKRWEALLVATKEGLTAGWIKTYGDDRSLRSHWIPHSSKKVEIHLTEAGTVRGRFLGPDGEPVAEANVRLTAVMVPRGRDLDKHIEEEETVVRSSSGLVVFTTVDYQETFYRPWLLPGMPTETKTDADGWFTLEGLPKDNIIRIEVTHPAVRTTEMRVAVREEPVERLFGSGFTHELPKGVTLRGQVKENVDWGDGEPISGATVALANHNASSGMRGQRFTTDAEGRFEITGLYEDGQDDGYDIAIVGSFEAPFAAGRFTVRPDNEARLEVHPAVPYQLTLTDADGNPVDRDVLSIVVQAIPGQVRQGVNSRYNDAVRVAPGVYQGIAPSGPGAVIVKRGSRRDRPVLVDPKEFFEPGRTDWTLEEERYAYGDEWQVTRQAVITTPALTPGNNWTQSQLDLAAVVFTNNSPKDGPLELSAVVYQDDPPDVTLVDDAGEPVVGARVRRQLTRYEAEDLPATFPLYGLHPERGEFIEFQHEERGLIGFLRATLTDEPLRVVMQPAAMLTGRFVTNEGETSYDFGMIVDGAVPPDTFLAGHVRESDEVMRGYFKLQVTPGTTYSGNLVRKTHEWRTRPTMGRAFGPLTPQPGETVDLGGIVVP